jgi:hypothetical protein
MSLREEPRQTPTEPPTQILLLGAGELGLALLSHITTLPNISITLGIRSASKYTHLASPTTSLLELDLSSPSPTLVAILSEYNVVISATGYTSSPDSVLKLANEMLSAGKLRRSRGKGRLWYFPWQWGVDYDITGDVGGVMPLFGAQKGVRDLLRSCALSSNVAWTVISTGMFMSFLFEPFWGVVDRDESNGEESVVRVRCLRDWDHGVTVTDVRDIGRCLTRILRGDMEAVDSVLYVAGDTVTYSDLAATVERVSMRQVVREVWDEEHLRRELQEDPEDGIKKYRLAFAGEGVRWEKEQTVNWKLGMDMMDVDRYARELFAVKK